MELDEWMQGYKSVYGYNFVALDDCKTDDDATAMFKKMDADGAGMVLMIEFSDYIKAAEIAAGTETGELLNADEAMPEGAPEDASGGGQVVPGGGVGPTTDFINFKGVFQPYCEQSEEGKKRRKKGFRAADRKNFSVKEDLKRLHRNSNTLRLFLCQPTVTAFAPSPSWRGLFSRSW